MKENLAYIALHFEDELVRSKEVSYTLPDGQKITIDNERFRLAEALFQSKLAANDEPSILDLLCDTIQKCDIDTISTFRYNVVLSGGNRNLFLLQAISIKQS